MGTVARSTKLFLIRHGETVDNVAQVFAGSRDSALTNHGYQQATRLGAHFHALGLCFTHIYSSHLQRAAITAGLLRAAQIKGSASRAPDVVQLPVLMEKDFGFYEGKKWQEKPSDPKITSTEQSSREHKNEARIVDVEPKDSMARRADTFLDEHLLPLLDGSAESNSNVVAIVSHGMMLSTLWKRLLLRLPTKSVSFSPELSADHRDSLEHLGAWSNTGYLELHLKVTIQDSNCAQDSSPPSISEHFKARDDATVVRVELGHSDTQQVTHSNTNSSKEDHRYASTQHTASATQTTPPKLAAEWTMVIQTINGKEHLKSLKRTGGGVGSARHDASQKSIEGFFKRRKVG